MRAVAHRGDPYLHRENTLPAVSAALAAGADAVEVDVQLTRDEVPVLLHDRTLERLWGDQRQIGRVTLDELAEVASPGLRIPTLAEALQAVAATEGARLMIDLDDSGPAAATWQAVSDLGMADRVAFCGPVVAMLAVRELDADAEISLTWNRLQLPKQRLLAELGPSYLNPPFGLVDERLVASVHDAGLGLATWTVDLRRTMRRMLALGVDSLTSNRITLLRRTIDQHRP
ncbi:putative glycerophosphoryl diester phosphodiesterase [Kitasatospora setae KM-6054]|uniref:Putative glycerophosphoryl diester phosphodiesterase n=1 Tax=Kitasatospora setae (strain ATCC 33774 / DSM 43861 / JCM 3304 / KCC A-0304 / NBRC 14216 / KM-6054) TaxID=452652 RepID=E4NJ75_KITSK|nr:putative glycerophosphoryl diester phosphodiesterase [Kitasatospora setae KM-6054]